MLINLAARNLHSLKHLYIATANAESLRGLERASASKKHFSFTTDRIAKAIVAYSPETDYRACLPAITANSIKYAPQVPSNSEVGGIEAKVRYRRVN